MASGGDHRDGQDEQDEELESAQAKERASLRPHVVHEVIRREGELELQRPPGALAWSGIAAGLSMGLSLLTQGLLRALLPPTSWAAAVERLGYSLGFIATILSRQQLFTENTLIAVLPLLSRRDAATFKRVARLWAVVLIANLVGAFLFAALMAKGRVLEAGGGASMLDVSTQTMEGGALAVFVRAILSGWMIALMVWMLPSAESARVFVILLVTYVIALAGFPHVVAGAVDAFYAMVRGAISIGRCASFLLVTLAGNVIGGVLLVAVVNHAQVVVGSDRRA